MNITAEQAQMLGSVKSDWLKKNQTKHTAFLLEFTPHNQRSKHALWGVMAIKTNECSIRGKAIFSMPSNNQQVYLDLLQL